MLTHLTGRWPQVSAQSVLDIILVAVLIYEFLALIKGTRAMPVLFGVGSIALAYYLSLRLQLHTVIWVMSNLLPYAILPLRRRSKFFISWKPWASMPSTSDCPELDRGL